MANVTNIAPNTAGQPAPPRVGFPHTGQPAQPQANNQADNAQQEQNVANTAPTTNKDAAQRALEVLNNVVGGVNVNLNFGVLKSSGNLYVQVQDQGGGTVRVQPSANFLRLRNALAENVKAFDRLA